MDVASESSFDWHEQVKSVTDSENLLRQICRSNFLSLWSYPNLTKDQGRTEGKGDGRELCDTLVLFGNHVVIFSDKYCELHQKGNVNLAWSRWHRTAVEESVQQIKRAENWIRTYPDRIFLDRKCTKPFPLEWPAAKDLRFHRVVVAHGSRKYCQDLFGGLGALRVDTSYHAATPLTTEQCRPFTVGRYSPLVEPLLILDDITLRILLAELDTISDFVGYLVAREELIRSGKAIHAAGEQELLAVYLASKRTFPIYEMPASLPEGLYQLLASSEAYQAKVKADHDSYRWDNLIDSFVDANLHGFDSDTTPEMLRMLRTQTLNGLELTLRQMAAESRLWRRFLSERLFGLAKQTKLDHKGFRLVQGSKPGSAYLFLAYPTTMASPYSEYRQLRYRALLCHSWIMLIHNPHIEQIVGISTDSSTDGHSEDVCLVKRSQVTPELIEHAMNIDKNLNLMKGLRSYATPVHEYPAWGTGESEKVNVF